MIVASVVFELLTYLLEKKYRNQLVELILQGEFEQFDSLANNKLVRYCMKPFNLEFIKLNSFLLRNDEGRSREQFEFLKNKRMNNAQKAEVYKKAFIFYVFDKDGENSKYYLDQINELTGYDDFKAMAGRYYEILIEKKTDMLDELLKETEELADEFKGNNEYLLAEIYGNLGKKKESDKYAELASEHLGSLFSGRQSEN